MIARRLLILFAACWHLLLTAVVLPAHVLSHAGDSHCCSSNTGQLDDLQTVQAAQHHSGDCQLCKLDSRIQPADITSSGDPFDLASSISLPLVAAHYSSVYSEHFSGRAPPVSFVTTIVVG